jgi:MYXO-CTERM domain-containing protein
MKNHRLAFVLVTLLALLAARPALAQVVAPSPTSPTDMPAAADAGAPVPTEQASKGCGKGCTMHSSGSSSSSAWLASIALVSLLVLRRRST